MTRTHMSKLLAAFLSLLLISSITMLGGCSKSEQAAEPEETTAEEEPTIYGDASLGIDAKVDEDLRDYRNILLLGIDNGNRSDLMMVLRVNKNTNEIKSVAVHRDTYMQIAEDGTYRIDGVEREFFKCNRAYKRDGIYGAMKELNRHMDLNIKECIAIDWSGVAHLIDLMGGIDADIQPEMLSSLNRAIAGAGRGDDEQISSSGTQHLNGWQAVEYLRVRKYDGGSAPVREDRNQDVLGQLFDKAKGMSITELSDIYDQVAMNLETNMSRNTLTDTLATIATSTLEGTPGWPYDYSTLWQDDDSYYYFVADTLSSNVTELHKTLFDQDNYEPTETVVMLNDKIEAARTEQLH